MRASFTLPCTNPECGENSRFVAEVVAPGEFEVTAAHYACRCPERPGEHEAREEGARALADEIEGHQWAALAGRSEDL